MWLFNFLKWLLIIGLFIYLIICLLEYKNGLKVIKESKSKRLSIKQLWEIINMLPFNKENRFKLHILKLDPIYPLFLESEGKPSNSINDFAEAKFIELIMEQPGVYESYLKLFDTFDDDKAYKKSEFIDYLNNNMFSPPNTIFLHSPSFFYFVLGLNYNPLISLSASEVSKVKYFFNTGSRTSKRASKKNDNIKTKEIVFSTFHSINYLSSIINEEKDESKKSILQEYLIDAETFERNTKKNMLNKFN